MKWIIFLHCVVVVLFSLIRTVPGVAPVINNLVNSTQISEDTTDETLLYTLNVTDTDTSAYDVTCSVGAASNPASTSSFFRLRQITGTSDWGIYTLTGITFDYSTQPQYQVDVDCSDGTTTVDGTYTVYLSQNAAPVFQNLPNTTNLSLNAAIGETVFSMSVLDTENDQLYYNITCSPTGCPFTIYASGEIQLNGEVPTSVLAYDVTVTVFDAKNTATPLILTVYITDINSSPTISNLGSTISVPENTAVNTLQVTTACTDTDTSDTLTYSMTCTPSSGLTYFQINSSSGEISTSPSSVTNYEALVAAGSTSFVCSVLCSDGALSASASVTFDVSDVNEAPSFAQTGHSVTIDEGAAGTVLHSSGYSVIDPDSGDTAAFSIGCGAYTSYFTIDTTTGNTNFSSEYDVDSGSRPSNVDCNLTVTDSGGLTETITLSYYIGNINDNTPIFVPTTYSWFVSYGASVSAAIDYVNASDADAGTYGDITYSLQQTNLGAEYFGITATGLVYVKGNLSALAQGGTYTFNATATDGGSLSAIATISVLLASTTTVTTTTTTDRQRTFFEDTRNIAWFSACIVILATIMSLGVYMFCFYYEGRKAFSKANFSKLKCQCCEIKQKYRPPPTPVTPITPPETVLPPPRPVRVLETPPSEGFNFWHKMEHVG